MMSRERRALRGILDRPGAWRRNRSRRGRRIPRLPLVVLILVFLIPAFFAELLEMWLPFVHDPFAGDLGSRLMPPAWIGPTEVNGVVVQQGGSWNHVLGTDRVGRDLLSRIIFGARVSLTVAVIAVSVAAVIGTALGLVAGYFGGIWDTIVMRLCDALNSIQGVLLALVLAVVLAPGLSTVIIVVVMSLWTSYTRLARAEVLSLRERDFVQRAKVVGCSSPRILFRHLLPNILNSLLVLVTLEVGLVILMEASLSFLNIGIPRPNPAWGLMVADGRDLVVTAWWTSMFPGVAIFLTVLSIYILGDWVRDRLDPRRTEA